jgi:heat shock protein HtpX
MFTAFGLYTHIRSNRIRSVLLVAGLFLLVWLIAYAFTLFFTTLGRGNLPADVLMRRAVGDWLKAMPFVTLGTAAWVFAARRFHQGIIDAVTGSKAVERAAQPRLYNLLENLCISRGLPVPKLEIIASDVLNAYATGLTSSQYTITVTTGLLAALDDAEVEAVLAHELTHIRNEDVKLMVVAAVVAGVISFFAEMFFRVVMRSRWSFGSGSRSSDDRKGGGAVVAIIVAVALIAAAWLLSLVIRFALSRSREFLADAGAVELTKNPDAMISALMKIAGRSELEGVPSGIMEMCIDNPRTGFADLFATHPPIEDRIEALVKFAGGRLPDPAQAPVRRPLPGAPNGQLTGGPDPDAPASPWGRPAGTTESLPGALPGGPVGPWGPHAG